MIERERSNSYVDGNKKISLCRRTHIFEKTFETTLFWNEIGGKRGRRWIRVCLKEEDLKTSNTANSYCIKIKINTNYDEKPLHSQKEKETTSYVLLFFLPTHTFDVVMICCFCVVLSVDMRSYALFSDKMTSIGILHND